MIAGVLGIGIVFAMSEIFPLGAIPQELQLKALKEDILSSEDVDDIRGCDGRDEKPCQNFGKAKFYYYRGNEVLGETYKGLAEDLSRRTEDTQFFPNGKEEIVRIYLREVFSKKADKWYRVKSATTTIDAFDEQTISFWGNPAFALASTSSIGADSMMRDATELLKDTNYGSNAQIYVQTRDTPNNIRMVFRFTMPNLTGTITAVKTYWYNNYDTATQPAIEAHQLTQTAWTEAGVTWNKYDGTNIWTDGGGDFSETVIDTLTPPSEVQYNAWDLMGTCSGTCLTLTWNDVVNILFIGNPEGTADVRYTNFESRQAAANTPYAEITYSVVSAGAAPRKGNIIFFE